MATQENELPGPPSSQGDPSVTERLEIQVLFVIGQMLFLKSTPPFPSLFFLNLAVSCLIEYDILLLALSVISPIYETVILFF